MSTLTTVYLLTRSLSSLLLVVTMSTPLGRCCVNSLTVDVTWIHFNVRSLFFPSAHKWETTKKTITPSFVTSIDLWFWIIYTTSETSDWWISSHFTFKKCIKVFDRIAVNYLNFLRFFLFSFMSSCGRLTIRRSVRILCLIAFTSENSVTETSGRNRSLKWYSFQ